MSVDTHGVDKDTDGDGVPDCKDKQLITPTECLHGVGNAARTTGMGGDKAVQCPCDYPSPDSKAMYFTLNADNRVYAGNRCRQNESNNMYDHNQWLS